MNKIEALNRQRAEEQERLDRAQRHLDHIDAMLRHAQSDTTISADGSPTYCSGCGADVSTEALFSAHYVIPDYRFANLGNCPNRKR